MSVIGDEIFQIGYGILRPTELALNWVIGAIAAGILFGLVAGFYMARWRYRQWARDNSRTNVAQLQRSHDCLWALLNYTSDIIAILTVDGDVDYVSPSIQTVLGYGQAAWVGYPITELIAPDDRPKLEQLMHQMLQYPGRKVRGELRCPHADGEWRIFDLVACNLLAQPSVRGIVIIYRDITHYRQSEALLCLLESVVVHAKDAVLITEAEPIDPPGPRIIYVNEEFTRQTGYTLEDVIGRTPRILQGQKSDRATLDRIRQALSHWQPIVVDVLNYRKDGTEFWAELSIVPVADDKGLYTHWVAVQRDITNRKQVEEEIRRALQREKELRELKSRFISMVSHEFRTPLATILASSDLLKAYGHRLSEPKKLERLNKIQAEVHNMTQLLDDVLLMGRAEAGRIPFNPEWLDLKSFCEEILEEISLWSSPSHSFRLSWRGETAQAKVDAQLLRQILTNLLSNAVKYSPEGGVVHLCLECTPAHLTFCVQDSGIGIPADDRTELFEPFYRASNASAIPGTGLGLAIIKHAVELHGGQIQLTSQVGVGSTFTVVIPQSEPPA